MKHITRLVLGATALLGSSMAAFATPSTLVFIPSTDVQAPRSTHLTFDSYFTFDNKPGSSTTTDTGLTWGFKKFEVGFDHIGSTDDPFLLNAKYQILPEKGKNPALAIGGYNFGGSDNSLAGNLWYGLVSKTFEFGRLHLGYQKADEDRVPEDDSMVMLGWDKQFTPKWWGCVDYASGDSAFGALSLGVAYSFASNTSVIFGYDFYNNNDIEDTITVQLDINF
jgi:hypothetical protein